MEKHRAFDWPFPVAHSIEFAATANAGSYARENANDAKGRSL